LVTHGVSHLYKCNEIVVVSRGEITDHGTYNELMNKSKILRDLVHSIVTSEAERKSSDAGIYILHYRSGDDRYPSVVDILEERKSVQN
jgi:ABC-type methionine transport system ATPase subunit